jgi:hypothetical protein
MTIPSFGSSYNISVPTSQPGVSQPTSSETGTYLSKSSSYKGVSTLTTNVSGASSEFKLGSMTIPSSTYIIILSNDSFSIEQFFMGFYMIDLR